jgi:hypothetical protein
MKLFVLGLAAALGFSSAASAADCLDVATRAIEQKGFTVRGTSTLEELDLPNDGAVAGYRAWLRVARCDNGYVIVNMHQTCVIKDIWALGGCDVPEIRQALRDHD